MAGLGIVVKPSGDKGLGVFATRDFEVGDVIVTEEPIVSAQYSWNKLYKYRACDYCMKSLETAQEMCRRLVNDEDMVIPHLECCQVDQSLHVKCEDCGEWYCSEECRKKALGEFHKTLCMSDKNPLTSNLKFLDKAWRQLHYPPETLSPMLIAKILAKIKQADDKEKVIKELREFISRTENKAENIMHKLMGEQFDEQIDFLRKQFAGFLYEESVADWFTPEGFRSFLALLGTNQQGVGSSSFAKWARNCNDLGLPGREQMNLDFFIVDLYMKLDEESGDDFLDCEGVGLYRLQSRFNHSCVPDAEIYFEDGNHKLTVKALKPITSGNEIHICYFGQCIESRSRHTRQKILSEAYLFVCHCPKCEEQIDDPDVTSDESEDEE